MGGKTRLLLGSITIKESAYASNLPLEKFGSEVVKVNAENLSAPVPALS